MRSWEIDIEQDVIDGPLCTYNLLEITFLIDIYDALWNALFPWVYENLHSSATYQNLIVINYLIMVKKIEICGVCVFVSFIVHKNIKCTQFYNLLIALQTNST